MDLLKLKLKRTNNIVGNDWRSYEVDDMPEIEAVLVKVSNGEYPETLDIMVLEEPSDEPKVCTAKFLEMGMYKINCIKAVREATYWGLKESKDFVESFPTILTPKDGFTRQTLATLVQGVNSAGGKAEMTIGKYCDNCELRFRCFTER